MLTLFKEIVLNIVNNISEREKMYLTSTCKQMNASKYKLIYVEKIRLESIIKLSYFDNFRNIEANDVTHYPKNVTHLTFDNNLKAFSEFL